MYCAKVGNADPVPGASLFQLIQDRFLVIDTSLDGLNADTVNKVHVFVLAEIHGNLQHSNAISMLVNALGDNPELGLFAESESQLEKIDLKLKSISEIWDIESESFEDAFTQMNALALMAQTIYLLHEKRRDLNLKLYNQILEFAKSQLKRSIVDEIRSQEAHFFAKKINFKQFMGRLVLIVKNEMNLLTIAFTQIVKQNHLLRSKYFKHAIFYNLLRYTQLVSLCSARHALLRSELLPYRPYSPREDDELMDKYVDSFREKLKRKQINYVILLPKGEPHRFYERDDSMADLAKRLDIALSNGKKGTAFDHARFLMQKLEEIFK